MIPDRIYSFAFKGLLTEQSLDSTDRSKQKIFGEKEEREISERLGISLLDEQSVASSRRMSLVYIAISAFENDVREFVSKKLSETKGNDWWNSSVPEKIRKKAETRRDTESNTKWHTPRGDAFINYTEFGDLVSIIQHNWSDFEPHIVELEWARQIILTLEKSRNVIMHSGELSPHDIERIGMNIRDWVRQVG